MTDHATQGLRILIIGRGRMGSAVQEAALRSGHLVAGVMGRSEMANSTWPKADVAVEFTAPDSAVDVIAACRQRMLPLVSGTTGWAVHADEVQAASVEAGHPLLWAPNFSKGDYLFRKALKGAAQAMEGHAEFVPSVHEVHHTGKLDAPSGTAHAIGEDLSQLGWPDVPITAQRLSGVPGTHEVEWRSEIDSISLIHSAQNRSGFAQGAIEAAEWLSRHTGPCHKIFGMSDVWG